MTNASVGPEPSPWTRAAAAASAGSKLRPGVGAAVGGVDAFAVAIGTAAGSGIGPGRAQVDRTMASFTIATLPAWASARPVSSVRTTDDDEFGYLSAFVAAGPTVRDAGRRRRQCLRRRGSCHDVQS